MTVATPCRGGDSDDERRAKTAMMTTMAMTTATKMIEV